GPSPPTPARTGTGSWPWPIATGSRSRSAPTRSTRRTGPWPTWPRTRSTGSPCSVHRDPDREHGLVVAGAGPSRLAVASRVGQRGDERAMRVLVVRVHGQHVEKVADRLVRVAGQPGQGGQ